MRRRLIAVTGLAAIAAALVIAPDLDTAQRIAATCPHLRYGGRIVVKRIVS